MLMFSVPSDFKVGDTVSVRINFRPTPVTWRDADTVVLGDNDARKVAEVVKDGGLQTFFCGDADGSEPTVFT